MQDYDAVAPLESRSRRWLALALVAALLALGGLFAFRAYGRHQLAELREEAEARFGSLEMADLAPEDGGVEGRTASGTTAAAPTPEPTGEGLAAPLALSRAAEELTLTPDEQPLLTSRQLDPGRAWSAADLAAYRELLIAHAADLARLRGVARRPMTGGLGLDYAAGPDLPLGLLWKILSGSKLLRAHALLSLHTGDAEAAAGSLAALGAIAEVLWREPLLVSELSAASVEHAQLALARLLLLSGAPAATLTTLRVALLDRDPGGDLARAAHAELAMGLATDRRAGRAMPGGPLLHAEDYFAGDFQMARVLRPALTAAEVTGGPFAEAAPRLAASARDTGHNGRYAALGVDWENVALRFATVAAARRLGRLAYGLRLAGLRDGVYPHDLRQVEGRLPADPLAGGPVGYVRFADGRVRLSLPQAVALLAERRDGRPVRREPLASWELPAAVAISPPGAPAERPADRS